jgi:FixJ family two-component response regulator
MITPETNQPLIVVIDDVAAVCRSVSRLLVASGYRTATYQRPIEYLDDAAAMAPGCVVADIRMPELDGIGLSQAMRSRGIDAPIVFMTATGDVDTVVRAMKQNASDLLAKPFTADALLGAVTRAIDVGHRLDDEHRALLGLWRLAGRLTPREAEVCALVACGSANKVVAARLGTTEKTIKVHRGRVMSKLAATSLAELVRMVDRLLAAESQTSIRLDGMERLRPRPIDIIVSATKQARADSPVPLDDRPTLVR